jgi:V8-like Glu-specific endopeptidase
MFGFSKALTIVAAAATVAGGLLTPAYANVFAFDGQDPRVASPRTGPNRLYAPVGAVTTIGKVPASDDGARQIRTRGSAFLVSPCYVLTNYHAVFGLDYDGPDPERDYAVTFSVGADPDYLFRWKVRAVPVRWGAFNKRKEHDWALLKLEGCVGGQADIGWLELSAMSGETMVGLGVALAGYPADKAGDTLWVQPDCRIEGMQKGTAKVLHACSVHSGASGGPLIEHGRQGPAVVAIQCGELNSTAGALGRYDSKYANTAVTIAEIFEDGEVEALLQADRAAFPTQNPALDAASDQHLARAPDLP